MERVLDTAALLHWPPQRLAGGVCAPSQIRELEALSPARALLVESSDLVWRAVSTEALEQAKACAKTTGDLPRLSDVDLDILALALEVNGLLVTDDYRLQNTYQHAGGSVEPVANAPSKQVWIWEQRCTGCGASSAVSSDASRSKKGQLGDCGVCGSPVVIKRRRS